MRSMTVAAARPVLRRALIAWPLWAIAALAGCNLMPPEPEPLRGPAPRTIAISPAVPAAFAEQRALLMTGLGEALAARGQRAMAIAVVEQMLVDAGVDAATATPQQVAAATGADAVLVLGVERFEVAGERPLDHAAWDLSWRLLTAAGGTQWRREARGTWRASDVDQGERMPSFEQQNQPTMHPIGGPTVPVFDDAIDLVSWLHRSALAYLPRGRR
jgi:hypothetical protein